MYACKIVVLFVGFVAGHYEIFQEWTCPKAPMFCPFTFSVAKMADECRIDNDCQDGAQCCYRGCVRKCDSPEPCEHVICKDGYLCQSRETPCKRQHCPLEATCLPANQVRCITPVCNTEECQPGFERGNDTDGCPTCECVRKKECGPNCMTFCAFGFEEGPDGCPVCNCKPEPENLCTNQSCGDNQECRFVQVVCKKAPCKPVAMCVPRAQVPYENTCSLTDPTTVGLPILDLNTTAEIDCSMQPCPDNTVCANIGKEIKRCCWQITQEEVLTPPKAGQCPSTVTTSGLTQKCQVDGACHGEQKCCYRQTDVNSSRSLGFCTNPIHNTVKNASKECEKFTFVRIILSWFGIC